MRSLLRPAARLWLGGRVARTLQAELRERRAQRGRRRARRDHGRDATRRALRRSSRRGASGRPMGQDSGSPSGWHQLLPRLRPPAESVSRCAHAHLVERRLRDALCAEADPIDELPGGGTTIHSSCTSADPTIESRRLVSGQVSSSEMIAKSERPRKGGNARTRYSLLTYGDLVA